MTIIGWVMNLSLVRSPITHALTNAETWRLRNNSFQLRCWAMYNNGRNIRWTRSSGREKFATTFGSRNRNCGLLGCCCDLQKLGHGRCCLCKSAACWSNSINRRCAQSYCPTQSCPRWWPCRLLSQQQKRRHIGHARTRNRKSIRKNIRESELNVDHFR